MRKFQIRIIEVEKFGLTYYQVNVEGIYMSEFLSQNAALTYVNQKFPNCKVVNQVGGY